MSDPFAKAFKLIEETSKANSIAYKGEFSVNMLQRFARDTPVKDGHATGNWILKGGSPNLTNVTFTDKTITASPTTKRARNAYKDIKLKENVYISNAVQGNEKVGNTLKSGKKSTKRFTKVETGEGYIIGLEHGKSKQAPNGMFLINLVKAKEVSEKALRKIFK